MYIRMGPADEINKAVCFSISLKLLQRNYIVITLFYSVINLSPGFLGALL